MFASGKTSDLFLQYDVCLLSSLERAGVLLRLEKSILPARNRLATLSTAELAKLTQVKNVVRKGRLAEVTGSSLVFLSGEQVELRENSLVVDCAVNGIKFKPKTEIFQGNKIILQYIMFPPIALVSSGVQRASFRKVRRVWIV